MRLVRCLTAATALVVLASMAAPVALAEFPIDTQLRVSTSMGVDGDPAFEATNADVAYDVGRDRYMVVWQGTRPGADGPQIYGHLVSRSHERISLDVQISDTPHELVGDKAPRLTEEPTITFNPSENQYLVLWTARHDAGGSQIYGQRLGVNGNRLAAADIPISETGSEPASVDAHAPALAYDSTTGSQFAVWHSDDEVPGKHEIYGRSVSGKVPVLGAEVQISKTAADGDKDAEDPAVAYDAVNHRLLVAWSSDDAVDTEREIYTRAYDGSQMGAQTRVSHMGPDGDPAFDAFDPALAFDTSSREYLLVWRGDAAGENGQFEVYGQRLDAGNAGVGATDFRISDMGPDGNPAYAVRGRPSVEYLSVANRYLVLWHGNDDSVGGETEVFAQALAADGLELGANDFRVTSYGNSGTTNSTAESPAAAYNPQANQTLVAYEGTGHPPLALLETEIFSRPVGDDSDGDGVFDGLDGCRTVSGAPLDADADGCPDDRDGDGVVDALDGCAGVGGGAFDGNRDGCPDDSDGDGMVDGVDRCGAVSAGFFDADANGCPDDRDNDDIVDALDGCRTVPGGAFDANRDGCPDDSDGDRVLDAADPCRTTAGGRLDVNRDGCPGPFRSLDRVRLSPTVVVYRRHLLVLRLKFRDMPAVRVGIRLRCVRVCKLEERLVKPAGPRLIHSRVFKGRRLRIGAVITARMTAPDMIGSVRRYRVTRGDIVPLGKALCIPLRATQPRTTCKRGR